MSKNEQGQYICGAETQGEGECQRPVSGPTERCYDHPNQETGKQSLPLSSYTEGSERFRGKSVQQLFNTVFSTIGKGDVMFGILGGIFGAAMAHEPDIYIVLAQLSPLLLGGGSVVQRALKAAGKDPRNPYTAIRFADSFFAMMLLNYGVIEAFHSGFSLVEVLRQVGLGA